LATVPVAIKKRKKAGKYLSACQIGRWRRRERLLVVIADARAD
jgi:hypothetical protein